tara:strand:- start:1200 stop:1445 length:246 start_codon:yes stop_codon:yes gene_type:complete
MAENDHHWEDAFGTAPLSEAEIVELRALIVEIKVVLENERRMVWLRSSIRVWSSYIVGFIIASFALYKAVSEYFLFKIGVR